MNIKTESRKGILFASFTALMWGLLAIALKVVLKDISPINVTWFRFSLSFVMIFIYYLIKRPSALKILAKPPLILIFASIALGLNYLGFIVGISLTTPGIAQVFIQSGSVLLAISGFIIFKEKASMTQILGLIMVFAGLLVFYNEQLMNLSQDAALYHKGVIWIIFGGVMWAIYAVFQKKLILSFDPLELNLVLFGIPALAYSPFVNYANIIHAPISDWMLLLFVGFNTLIAYGSLAYAFKYMEANKISAVITLNPLITFGLMAIFTSVGVKWIAPEKYAIISITGALSVIIGTILTVMGPKKKNLKLLYVELNLINSPTMLYSPMI
jgi:drug/metabolite transporter (DMT)-like permease